MHDVWWISWRSLPKNYNDNGKTQPFEDVSPYHRWDFFHWDVRFRGCFNNPTFGNPMSLSGFLRQEKSRKSRWHFEGECSPTKWKERDSRSVIMRHADGGWWLFLWTIKPYWAPKMMFAKTNKTLCDLTWTFLWYGSMLDELWPFAEFPCMYRKKLQSLKKNNGEAKKQSISRVSCVKSALSPWWLWSLFETEVAMVCSDPISNFVRQIIQVPHDPEPVCFCLVFVKDWISNDDRWW